MSPERAQESVLGSSAASNRLASSPVTTAPLLTIAEVAKLLAISERSVKRLLTRRGLRCVRLGRSLRFDPADVSRFVAARKE